MRRTESMIKFRQHPGYEVQLAKNPSHCAHKGSTSKKHEHGKPSIFTFLRGLHSSLQLSDNYI